MSEILAINEARDLPSVQFRSVGVVYAPSPAPMATLILPDNSTEALTLTQQGSDATTRYLVAGFTRAAAGQYEVRYATADTAADIAEYVEYVSVITSVDDPLMNAVPGSYPPGSGGYALGLLPGISLKTGLLGTYNAVMPSPLNPNTGDIEIVRGDSYVLGIGRALEWSNPAWSVYSLSTAKSITLKARTRYSDTIFAKAALTPLADAIVRVELTTAETGSFAVGHNAYAFEVEAILADDSVITLALGKIHVVEDVR